MPSSTVSSLSSLGDNDERSSLRTLETLNDPADDDREDAEDVALQARQSLRRSRSFSSEFVERIQYSFDGSPDLELRPETLSSAHEVQHPSEDDEPHAAELPQARAETICAPHEHGQTEANHHRMWTPMVLHWVSLTAFGVIFVATLAALEILHYFSRKHNGLSEANPKDYYLWTYGPTGGTIIAYSSNHVRVLTCLKSSV